MNKTDGTISIVLDEYMKKHNISKNFLARTANIQYTQLQAYCKNEIHRPDLGVLSRICTALDCDISDILKLEK